MLRGGSPGDSDPRSACSEDPDQPRSCTTLGGIQGIVTPRGCKTPTRGSPASLGSSLPFIKEHYSQRFPYRGAAPARAAWTNAGLSECSAVMHLAGREMSPRVALGFLWQCTRFAMPGCCSSPSPSPPCKGRQQNKTPWVWHLLAINRQHETSRDAFAQSQWWGRALASLFPVDGVSPTLAQEPPTRGLRVLQSHQTWSELNAEIWLPKVEGSWGLRAAQGWGFSL